MYPEIQGRSRDQCCAWPDLDSGLGPRGGVVESCGRPGDSGGVVLVPVALLSGFRCVLRLARLVRAVNASRVPSAQPDNVRPELVVLGDLKVLTHSTLSAVTATASVTVSATAIGSRLREVSLKPTLIPFATAPGSRRSLLTRSSDC